VSVVAPAAPLAEVATVGKVDEPAGAVNAPSAPLLTIADVLLHVANGRIASSFGLALGRALASTFGSSGAAPPSVSATCGGAFASPVQLGASAAVATRAATPRLQKRSFIGSSRLCDCMLAPRICMAQSLAAGW
jgi:hypothetical protein